MGVFPNFTQINLMTLLSMSTSAYTGHFYVDGFNLVYAHETAEVSYPVFYAHTKGDDLYITTRGSQDQEDFETYNENQEIKTKYGTFHAGYYKAAMNVFSKAYSLIIKCNGNIYCTGHSYGGSVSQILTILIHQIARRNNSYAIAFGPVICVDPITAENYKDNIITIINKGDIFPTISINNFRNLFDQKHPNFQGVVNGYQIYSEFKLFFDEMNITNVPAGSTLRKTVFNHFKNSISNALKIGKGKSFSLKYPIGLVYHIGMDGVNNIYDCLVNAAEEFNVVSLDVNAVAYHTPRPYNNSLNTLSFDFK